MERWVVSACLLGQRCRYDGHHRANATVQHEVSDHRAAGGQVIAVCPEELGGLPTPRPPAELHGGDGAQVLLGHASVHRKLDHTDVTTAFLRGAKRALEVGDHPQRALLKARSPSCGCGQVWQDGQLQPGDGVFAALLRRTGAQIEPR